MLLDRYAASFECALDFQVNFHLIIISDHSFHTTEMLTVAFSNVFSASATFPDYTYINYIIIAYGYVFILVLENKMLKYCSAVLPS